MATLYGRLLKRPRTNIQMDNSSEVLVEELFNMNYFDRCSVNQIDSRLDRQWVTLHFFSEKPLMKEEELGFRAEGYNYLIAVVLSSSTNRLVIVSSHPMVTEAAIEAANDRLASKLECRRIHTANAAATLLGLQEKKTFALTMLNLAILSFGNKLTSATLFGDDIAGAQFLDQLNSSEYLTTGLGIRSIDNHLEVGRFFNDGRVVLYSDRSHEFLLALSFFDTIECLE